MSEFKWRHFSGEIILQCVRWYCKYGISYRDLEEMMAERGTQSITPPCIVGSSATPRSSRNASAGIRAIPSASWCVDETHIKVKGKWKYLYRAIDKHGRLIDFFLSDRRNAKATKRFLGKALRTRKDWPPLSSKNFSPSRLTPRS
jgi:IS6 family transposase